MVGVDRRDRNDYWDIMATQTIEFRSPPSQTVTLRLFVVGSDTQVASAVATEATNRKGTYAAAFTDVPALEYEWVATIGSSPIIPVASGYVLLTLTTATFKTYDFAKDRDGGGGGATAEEIAEEVWGFDLATAAANTAGAALAAVATSFTKAFRWLGVIAGKGSDPATLAEIRETDGGATFDNATDSLEALGDAVGALPSAAVAVLPAVGISASRAPGVFLSPFVGELISQSITVYASDGTTPIDLSGKTLEIVFEARGGGDVAVIVDGDITVSGDDDNVVTFAYPSAVTAQERTLRFSLRDAGSPFTVYLTGLCKVSIAPSNDPA